MKLQARRVVIALAGALLAGVGAGTCRADFPQPLERLGRLYGVCWGDGYHACKRSDGGVHKDLPPTSNRTRLVSHRISIAPAPRGMITYYDRFDASGGGRSGSKPCDQPSCDSPCDSSDLGSRVDTMMLPGNSPNSSSATDPTSRVRLPSAEGPPVSGYIRRDETPELAAPDSASEATGDEASGMLMPQTSEPLAAASPRRLRPYRPAPPAPKPQRPVRLGQNSESVVATSVKQNPFAARPAVELAERISDRPEHVVRQPTRLK